MSDQINYRQPMTKEEIDTYVSFVLNEISEESILSDKGLEYVMSPDNIPNPEDQETIKNLVEEKYNAKKQAKDRDNTEGQENNSKEKDTCEAGSNS